jgi:hypothetical protein
MMVGRERCIATVIKILLSPDMLWERCSSAENVYNWQYQPWLTASFCLGTDEHCRIDIIDTLSC